MARQFKVDAWYRITSIEQGGDAAGALAAQEARTRKALSTSGATVHCPPTGITGSSYEIHNLTTAEQLVGLKREIQGIEHKIEELAGQGESTDGIEKLVADKMNTRTWQRDIINTFAKMR